MLPLDDGSGVEVKRKRLFASECSLDQSLRFELQLIAPIVGVWMVVFLVSICIYATRSWSRGFGYFLLTHFGLGVFMTAIWISFYGSMSWKRIMAGISLVAATAVFGVCITISLGGPADPQIWIVAWVPVFVLLASLVLTGAARRFWGWRIFHVRHAADVVEQKRFSIRDVFVWTTFIAVVLTLLRLLLALFDDNFADQGWRIAILLILGVLMPSVATIAFLGLVSRVRMYWLVLVVPALAACIAIPVSVLALVENSNIGFVMKNVFWPTQKWFSAAGFVLAVTIWYLRQHGVIFACGAGNDPASLERATTHYESSLRRKIARHERRRESLQSELDAARG